MLYTFEAIYPNNAAGPMPVKCNLPENELLTISVDCKHEKHVQDLYQILHVLYNFDGSQLSEESKTGYGRLIEHKDTGEPIRHWEFFQIWIHSMGFNLLNSPEEIEITWKFKECKEYIF